MSDPAIKDAIRCITEGILLVEASDLEQLATYHTKLQDVANWAGMHADPAIKSTAELGLITIEKVMLRDAEDEASALDLIVRVVTFLQEVVVDGQPVSQAKLPAEIAETSVCPSTPNESSVATSLPPSEQVDAPASETSPEAMPLTADPSLASEFVTESQEHLEAVDMHLLSMESGKADAEAMNAVFRAFHTIKGVAGFLELKYIQELAHTTETLLDKCRQGKLALEGDALDVVFEATDVMKSMVCGVSEALANGGPVRVHADFSTLLPRIEAITNGETPAPKSAGASPSDAADKPSKTDQVKAPVAATAAVKETVRVEAERLDQLIDVIGEMVIAESMVSQSVAIRDCDAARLSRTLSHLDKITRELQELAMSLRMVPVRSTFQRMAKLARDVSKKLNKPIEFITSGEETELDKNVVDAIGDPLVHMVRNSIDHGIEDSIEDRRAAGKPDQGRVELRAFHKGGSIHIEIEDNGRGLDRERILAKAKERGLVRDNDMLDDSQVYGLIFEPGFSTAKKVTDVSGRGVGLDVVRRNIQALRGKVEIRSEKQKGTVFSIRLPLTLAIIEGMVIRLGDQRFIVPTLSIVRMIRPDDKDISTVFSTAEMLNVDDRLVPLHRLDKLFHIGGAITHPKDAAVMVVEHDNRQVAFLVDELLGQQQIVIKPLGPALKSAAGISGSAIMPDGRVGLILDVAGLMTLAESGKADQLQVDATFNS